MKRTERILVILALLGIGVHVLLDLFGVDAYVSVLSLTPPHGGPISGGDILLMGVYVLSYAWLWLIAPVLLIAAGLSCLLQRMGKRATA